MHAGWTQSTAVVLITGISASGKTTIAQALAERLPRSVHVSGDSFRRMIVNGRAEMTPDLDPEAVRQLRLRYRLTATVADAYVEAGFTAVVQDIVLGDDLTRMITAIRSRPLLVVVLTPSTDAVTARERARGKTGYREWTIAQLDDGLRRQTPRVGLWLDTSEQAPGQTVEEILERAWTEAAVP